MGFIYLFRSELKRKIVHIIIHCKGIQLVVHNITKIKSSRFVIIIDQRKKRLLFIIDNICFLMNLRCSSYISIVLSFRNILQDWD